MIRFFGGNSSDVQDRLKGVQEIHPPRWASRHMGARVVPDRGGVRKRVQFSGKTAFFQLQMTSSVAPSRFVWVLKIVDLLAY